MFPGKKKKKKRAATGLELQCSKSASSSLHILLLRGSPKGRASSPLRAVGAKSLVSAGRCEVLRDGAAVPWLLLQSSTGR